MAQTNIQTDRQINFEMTDVNNINRGATGKTKPIQRKTNIYEN